MSDYTMLSLGMISRGIFLFLLYFNFLYNFGGILNKAIIWLVLVGYEMICQNMFRQNMFKMFRQKSVS